MVELAPNKDSSSNAGRQQSVADAWQRPVCKRFVANPRGFRRAKMQVGHWQSLCQRPFFRGLSSVAFISGLYQWPDVTRSTSSRLVIPCLTFFSADWKMLEKPSRAQISAISIELRSSMMLCCSSGVIFTTS